jgi:hypothetical protein
MSRKADLRGRLLTGVNRDIEIDGETFQLAPIPLDLRTRLFAKLPKGVFKTNASGSTEIDIPFDAMIEIGGELIFECLMVDDGKGPERVFSKADRSTFTVGTSEDLIRLAQAAFIKLFPTAATPPGCSACKAVLMTGAKFCSRCGVPVGEPQEGESAVSALGKSSSGTPTSTSSSTTSASTDGSSKPADS